MLNGKLCFLSKKVILLYSILLLLVSACVLLCGCSQEPITRDEGDFPNIPQLMDRLAESPDEDFKEELNLDEGNVGLSLMNDLSGWHGLGAMKILIESENDNPKIGIYTQQNLYSTDSSSSYYMNSNGIVTKGTDALSSSNEYVCSFADNPLEVEQLFSENMTQMPDFDKEDEAVHELLTECGIDVDASMQEQRYEKSSPLHVMKAIMDGDLERGGVYGSFYKVIGKTDTPTGKPLYYQAYINIKNSMGYSDKINGYGYSYNIDPVYSVIDNAEELITADFRLNEPYQLGKAQAYGKQSSSPIDDSDVFSYMRETSDSDSEDESESHSSASTDEKICYKASDSKDAVFVLTIEDDDTWYVSLRSVVNGKIPEKIGGNVNGQGLISGKVYPNGEVVGEDGEDTPNFKFSADKKGIKVTCTKHVTSTAQLIEGYYYYDLNSVI